MVSTYHTTSQKDGDVIYSAAAAWKQTCCKDLLHLGWLVKKYSLRGPAFNSRVVHVVFVVDKVAMGQVLLWALCFSLASYPTSAPYLFRRVPTLCHPSCICTEEMQTFGLHACMHALSQNSDAWLASSTGAFLQSNWYLHAMPIISRRPRWSLWGTGNR
jgi:hypothetical protein